MAALAAEEVARSWGCRQIEAGVAGDAEAGTRLAQALGYVLRNRTMSKPLGTTPPALPPGSAARPMTPEDFAAWHAYESERYARTLDGTGRARGRRAREGPS
ncbi:hypothetical protein STENM327S_08070 [Streptomyces tendae]